MARSVLTIILSTLLASKLQTFKDWIIGCDNVLSCEAQSLTPDGLDEIKVSITRDAGPTAGVAISVAVKDLKDSVVFVVDRQKLAGARVQKHTAVVSGPQAMTLAAAMARGTTLELRAGDKVLAQPSLAGLSAALRYMDAQQGRADTTTAIVATGTRSAQTVKPAPALPVVPVAVPGHALKVIALSPEEQIAATKFADCADPGEPPGEIRVYALSTTQTLLLVPCGGSGAYNFNSAALIATGTAGRRSYAIAQFDEASPELINTYFDPETGHLGSSYMSRGLGDCGESHDYAWDGTMFRLVEVQAMNECRGSYNWIVLWRARTTPSRRFGDVINVK
jgi:Protein of unknown function (DUF1176)